MIANRYDRREQLVSGYIQNSPAFWTLTEALAYVCSKLTIKY